jgi:hypothetical protein
VFYTILLILIFDFLYEITICLQIMFKEYVVE